MQPYLFVNGKHMVVVIAPSPRAAQEYARARCFDATYAGLDTRTPQQRWDAQTPAYVCKEHHR